MPAVMAEIMTDATILTVLGGVGAAVAAAVSWVVKAVYSRLFDDEKGYFSVAFKRHLGLIDRAEAGLNRMEGSVESLTESVKSLADAVKEHDAKVMGALASDNGTRGKRTMRPGGCGDGQDQDHG